MRKQLALQNPLSGLISRFAIPRSWCSSDEAGGPDERPNDRGKTVTKPGWLSRLGLASSEKQIPQVVEIFENGTESKEALERAELRPRQVRYQAALRPDISVTCVVLNRRVIEQQTACSNRFNASTRRP
jgi:hypothetical protein